MHSEIEIAGKGLLARDAVNFAATGTAQAALDAKLRSVIDGCLAFIGLLDLDGTLREANEPALIAGGLAREDVVGRKFWDCYWWCYDANVAETLKRAVARAATGEVVRYDTACRMKDDTEIVIDFKISPVRDETGNVVYLVPSGFDITERKRFERALLESEERFRTLADNMSQFAWMADEKGFIFWYNKRWYDFTGTTLESMAGWGWTKIHHPDHVERVVANIQRSWDSGEAWEDVFPLRGADGGYRWFLSRALPIRDDSGRVVRWLGTNTDITAVRETEQRLRESEAVFRSMFAVTSLGKAQIDPRSGRFLRVNGALSRLTGYSETELLQLDDLAITHPSFVSESRSRLERLVAGAEVEFSVEKQYVRKDSSTFWGQVTVHAILDGNGPTRRATLVVQDISERKEAEQQRLLLMREVGHRSKNLLSVVQAIARQTARDSPPDRFIESFSRRLQGLSSSQDLLVAGDWKGVPLDELARSQLSHLGESRDVRLSISGTPLIVSASAAQAIGLALHELSTNALKYGSLSGLDGRVSVGWSLVDAAGGRRFVMSWTEVGGPPVTQPARRGFGSAVVERMASAALRGTASLVFLPDGVTWTLDAPAASVLEAAGDET